MPTSCARWPSRWPPHSKARPMESRVLARLATVHRALGGLQRIDPSLARWQELYDTAYYALDELAREAGGYAGRVDLDPQRLAVVQSRRDLALSADQEVRSLAGRRDGDWTARPAGARSPGFGGLRPPANGATPRRRGGASHDRGGRAHGGAGRRRAAAGARRRSDPAGPRADRRSIRGRPGAPR